MPRLGFPRKPRSAARFARRLFPLAALLAALLLLPLAVACSEPPPLKIGLLVDFDDNPESAAFISEKAFDLAIKQVNEGGGVFGQPVQAVKASSGPTPETAAAAARTLIESDGIHALVGPSFSSAALSVIGLAAEAGIPVITHAGTSPLLTTANDGDFLFRTALADNIQGPVLARVTSDQGVANVGVIYRDDAWGQGLSAAFLSEWNGPAAVAAFNPEQPTFLSQLQETAAGGAEALVVLAFGENTATIVQEAVDAGLYDRFTFGDGSRNPTVAASLRGVLGGMMGVSPATDVGTESSAAWEAAWQAEYGALPEEAFVKETYDAAIALALAAQAADSVDGAAIRDQLRQVAAAPGDRAIASADSVAAALKTLADGGQVNYEGATGKMNWDENGDRQSGYTSVWRFTADGHIEDVEVIPVGN